MAGRFFSSNDLRTFEGFNKELVGDLRTDKDGLINQQIKCLLLQIFFINALNLF